MHRLLLLPVLLLLWSQSGHAELMVGESLEWMVADSDLVVRGKIAKVESFNDEQQTAWEEATVQVKETIKGTPANTLTFLVRCVGAKEKPSKWQQEGVELLLFLVKSSRYESLDPDFLKIDLALRRWGSQFSFVRLNNKPQAGLFTMNFTVLKERNEVFTAVRSAAAYRQDNHPPEHRVEVPFESEVYQTLYSGSGVQLVVPADERLETRAQQWLKSKDPEARQQGALALQFFKSPENTELLRPLLSDPAYMTTTRGQITTRVFYVREAAFKTLSEWSVDVDKPVIEVPVDIVAPVDAVESSDAPSPEVPLTTVPANTNTTPNVTRMEWYDSLWKPSWTPAPSTIGLIWQILYPIILVTFGFVFVQAIRKRVPWPVALPFAINLVANLSFTPIQFGMRNLPLAAVDILIVWGTIIWMMVAVWKHHKWITVAQVPYFVWVSIATVLQWSMTWMNR